MRRLPGACGARIFGLGPGVLRVGNAPGRSGDPRHQGRRLGREGYGRRVPARGAAHAFKGFGTVLPQAAVLSVPTADREADRASKRSGGGTGAHWLGGPPIRRTRRGHYVGHDSWR